jgi:hypothetical protein
MAGDEMIFSLRGKHRLFGVTSFFGMRTSGLEEAPLFRREGTIFLSHKKLFPFLFGFQCWDGAEQEFGVRVQGPSKEILGPGHLHHLPHIHNSDSITDVFDDPKIMRDEEIGEA